MKTPTQRAEEAAGKIGEILFELYPQYPNRPAVTSIIQAAIEKATAELREANDNLFKIGRKYCVENKRLRAAQAEEELEKRLSESESFKKYVAALNPHTGTSDSTGHGQPL